MVFSSAEATCSIVATKENHFTRRTRGHGGVAGLRVLCGLCVNLSFLSRPKTQNAAWGDPGGVSKFRDQSAYSSGGRIAGISSGDGTGTSTLTGSASGGGSGCA